VERVTPTVDPVTRQVTVYVTIPNVEGRLVGGLYAEGRLTARSRVALLVPGDAVDLAPTPPTVLRLRGGVVELVPVLVGEGEGEREQIEVVQGLTAGDTVLVGEGRALRPGTTVRVQPTTSPAAPAPGRVEPGTSPAAPAPGR
jgi:multidrug efflux pump subunit AcrA (membrane-fusion protein)